MTRPDETAACDPAEKPDYDVRLHENILDRLATPAINGAGAKVPGDPAIAIPAKECLLTDDKDYVFVRASVIRSLIQSTGKAKYLTGWMTSQYEAGEKPPVGPSETHAIRAGRAE